MLWSDDQFDPKLLRDERLRQLLIDVVTRRALEQVRPGHFLTALIESIDEDARTVLAGALADNVQIHELPDAIRGRGWCPHREGGIGLTGARADFSEEAEAIIADLESMLGGGSDELPAADEKSLGLHQLWLAVVRHPDAEDRRFLGQLLDFDEAVRGFRRLTAPEPLPELFDPASGQISLDAFSDGVIAALEEAAEAAGTMGYQRIMPSHLFLALLYQPDGPIDWAVRLEAPEGKSAADVTEEVRRQLLAGREQSGTALALDEDHLADSTQKLIAGAMRSALLHGRKKVSGWDLAIALAQSADPRLASILGSASLGMSVDAIVFRLRQFEEQGLSGEREAPPFTVPPQIGAGEDLTHLARRGELPEAPYLDGIIDRICRALYRRQSNHVLIVGDPGIGKTTVVRELARRAAEGGIGFLERKRIVRIDTADVAAEEAGARLGEILELVRGRNDIILCIDGLGALLAADARGASGRPMLRSALKSGRLHMIGLMDRLSYTRHLAADPKELVYCRLVEMEEPDEAQAAGMLATIRPRLEREYSLSIETAAVETAVRLSGAYILSERLPAKAVRVLRIACDNIAYERQRRADRGEQMSDEDARVTARSIVTVVSEETGLPPSTLRGTGDAIDYHTMLASRVVGQDAAVRAAAEQLQLIKSGFKRPSKPAGVMLFVGLTGTGKTELAKAIAQVYSASRTLQTYTMGNFTEAHSVSNLIGSPPGYVGYEQGGPLINELNADPYSVVLLDEVDKAHPEVWKPLLNLLDEGWIVDRRNVKAYGTRAVFVLTSNAGADRITRLLAAGGDLDTIQASVKDHLASLRDEHGRPRFPPEFLARIERIVIFAPLSREAMRRITALRLEAEAAEFSKIRDKTLTWEDAVIELIGDLSHDANERSGGREGGRIVGKNVDEMVLGPITRLMVKSPDQFARACGVHLSVRDDRVALDLRRPEEMDLDEFSRPCLESLSAARATIDDALESRLEDVAAAVTQWSDDLRRWARSAGRPEVERMADQTLGTLQEQAARMRECASEGGRGLSAAAGALSAHISRTISAARAEEGA